MSKHLGWTFPVGQIFGIPLRAHWTLLALCAWMILKEKTPLDMGRSMAVCVLLCFTVVVHELGHAFAARGVGGQAGGIVLWPLGGLAYTSHPGGLIEEIKVVLGGPLTHIPLGAIFARLVTFQGIPWDWSYLNPMAVWPDLHGSFWAYLCLYGLKIQVGLLLFNLLVPIYPLDGCRLLVALMLFRFSPRRTAQVVMVLSALIALALAFMGSFFLVIWAGYEVYGLYQSYSQGTIQEHPLFARLRYDRAAARGKPSGGGVVLQFRKPVPKDVSSDLPPFPQKSCPFCARSLPLMARMCGHCEKMLPE